MALGTNVDVAKVLAFSYPQIAEGLLRSEQAKTSLTAIVEDELDRGDEAIAFAVAILEQSAIRVAGVSEMPRIAAEARREMKL